MKIELPTHKTTRKAELTPDLRTFTIIGANGAGKSRFGDDIAHKQKKNIFRLSALKALFVTPTNEVSVGTTITSLFNELQKKTTYRIETVETEFERLMYLLMYEEFINVMAYKHNESPNKGKLPRTKLDRVQRQWENIFPQNKMLRASGNISIVGGKDPRPYSPTRLSDGEKTVLYLLASVLFAHRGLGRVLLFASLMVIPDSIQKDFLKMQQDYQNSMTAHTNISNALV